MSGDNRPVKTFPGWPTRAMISGFALALSIALGVYLLLNLSKVGGVWVGSFWFLALFPAVFCGLICYIGDGDLTRPISFYWWAPLVLVAMVDVGSILFLREGVICLIMLSPIWTISGWIGAFTLRAQRQRAIDRKTLQSSFLIIPLLAGVVEAEIPRPREQVVLTRSVIIHATPADIWPFAVQNHSIGSNEGRWTITHNLIGLPRPRATVMVGSGVGAVRTAFWGEHINFDEIITEWAPERRLSWAFRFSNKSLQDYTDRHISPDGEFLKIDTGGYAIRSISSDESELTLTTRYIAMTHVNPYARLWGELILGDTQENVLTIIKNRSEAAHGRANPSSPED